jgi:hypothetical protein
MPIILLVKSSHAEENSRVRESNERRFYKSIEVKSNWSLILQNIQYQQIEVQK